MAFHHWLKILISVICFYSGMVALYRMVRPRRGLIILAYHRVADLLFDPLRLAVTPRDFQTHMRYLARNFRPISMSEALSSENQAEEQVNQVVVSFDDGYSDNYEAAFPVLQELGIPAIIFLTVGPIEQKIYLWFERITSSVHATARKSIDLSAFGLGRHSLATLHAKGRFCGYLVELLKKSTRERQEAIINHLEAELGSSRKPLMLTWDQINTMRAHEIEFGCHTFSHPIMTGLTPAAMREEIQHSQQIIAERLGEPVRYFAYPNGDPSSYNELVIDLLKENDFEAAMSMQSGINQQTDWHRLKRLGIDLAYSGYRGHFTRAVFACELSGFFDMLFLRSFRQSA